MAIAAVRTQYELPSWLEHKAWSAKEIAAVAASFEEHGKGALMPRAQRPHRCTRACCAKIFGQCTVPGRTLAEVVQLYYNSKRRKEGRLLKRALQRFKGKAEVARREQLGLPQDASEDDCQEVRTGSKSQPMHRQMHETSRASVAPTVKLSVILHHNSVVKLA